MLLSFSACLSKYHCPSWSCVHNWEQYIYIYTLIFICWFVCLSHENKESPSYVTVGCGASSLSYHHHLLCHGLFSCRSHRHRKEEVTVFTHSETSEFSLHEGLGKMAIMWLTNCGSKTSFVVKMVESLGQFSLMTEIPVWMRVPLFFV